MKFKAISICLLLSSASLASTTTPPMLQSSTSITTNLSNPSGLAIDSNNNLWVANLNNTVSRFSNSGAYQTNITTNLSSPSNVAVDSTR